MKDTTIKKHTNPGPDRPEMGSLRWTRGPHTCPIRFVSSGFLGGSSEVPDHGGLTVTPSGQCGWTPRPVTTVDPEDGHFITSLVFYVDLVTPGPRTSPPVTTPCCPGPHSSVALPLTMGLDVYRLSPGVESTSETALRNT